MKPGNLLLTLILLWSCGEDIRTIERRAKYKADSLFQYEYSGIIKFQDSICELKQSKDMSNLLDSIVEIRKQEIIKLQQGL